MKSHPDSKEKKFSWGGRAVATRFPAGGSVSLVGSIAAGSRSTKDDELAGVHVSMLLEGTVKLKKRELQLALDAIGASLSFAATNDRLVWYAKARAVHLPKLLDLITEVLLNPAFPSAELAILKKREEANLTMQAQDTYAQAGIALSRMLYRANHPNYSQTTGESLLALKKITPQALRGYHAKILNRNSLIISAAGDIDPIKFFVLSQRAFGSLPNKKIAAQKVSFAPAAKAARKAVYIKEKASIDYMAAAPARIANTHRDYPALVLGLQVLGNRGGFTGRLMSIVREEEGLTYGVYSYPSGFANDTDGHALAWATFAPQLFEQGRAAVLRELRRIAIDGAGEEEVRKHGNLFEARARVSLSNSGAIARATHDTIADKKPLSHLSDFPKRVAKLSAQEVNAVLKKYLNPAKLAEAAAGPIEKF